VKLSSHFHLVPRLRISGAVPLLPLYTFMALTRKLMLTQLNDGFSPRRHGFNPRTLHVGILVNKVALAQVFS